MSAEEFDSITLVHIATHPMRHSILRELEKGQDLYIKELSDRLGGLDRKLVAFHLMTLEKYGLVETYLKVKERKRGNPVVVRYSKLTDKAREVLLMYKLGAKP